jgi:hypothetical protein
VSTRTTLSYKVEYQVSDETITDMLDAAGYGMTTWAKSMDFKARGDNLYIEVTELDEEADDGCGEVHEVTYAKLREAFGKCADPGQDLIGRWVHEYFLNAIKDRDERTGEIDAGHIDASAGDVWVQIAVFGELVYG